MTSIQSAEKGVNINSISYGKLTWVYIEKPTNREVEYLAKEFNFHPLNLDDILSRVQRPKIDKYEDHLFIVLHFPVFQKDIKVTKPGEVNIFISEKYIITIHCAGDLKPLAKFFSECLLDETTRKNYMSRSSGLLLYH